MTRPFLDFPRDFVFGVATAAYQIEGAHDEGGRTPSIWDTFSHTPGKTWKGHTGDVACDHYHRYPKDIALMKELGIRAYRLSIAWPRMVPERGVKNQQGIDFYKHLLTALHEAEITPAVTLYHWDLPQWLDDLGGWLNRDVTEHFAEYAELVHRELGDLIPRVITHNEPWCSSFLGYALGVHAPGHTDWREAFTAAHHILLSHGRAVQAYRAAGGSGEVGITLNFTWIDPASTQPEDVAAAERVAGFSNRWFIQPVFSGTYPTDVAALVESRFGAMDFVKAGDLDVISTPVDFLGVNYYTRNVVAHQPNGDWLQVRHVAPPKEAQTEMGWEIHPESLYRLLHWIERNYTKGTPLYITENGAAFDDAVEDGAVHDVRRIDYVADHLAAAQRFIAEGGRLKGYYLWSLLDNYEWAFGYSKRFGIVHVDYETQARTVKDSARWYSGQIAHQHAAPTAE
ncbi:beta-glucosidase [Alicyclobacillus contaminans]|uniref:GH1 family beta-glucosidase n=1 Tax=Alicyclobacillus contaminans TaxID=392016 RepID=UPI000425BD1A|nr:GH1 family beta-glucosidase [Alicyclobacillus contaminans]GMA51182.1 beta-glucosidase [Alicyclobacillus contaminans]